MTLQVEHRYLVTDSITKTSRDEVIVQEISPKGKHVKLCNPIAKTTYWSDLDEFTVLEELPNDIPSR